VPKTRNALEIIDRAVGEDHELRQMIAEENVNAAVAQMIYEARKAAGLTQKQLADLVGTQQPVIARLEDADYEGHSLSMLNRIASALNLRLAVEMTAEEPIVDPVRFTFQTLMRDLRLQKRLTFDELSKRTGVEAEELRALERNPAYRPSPLTLHRLAEFYDIPQRRLAELAGALKQRTRLRDEASRFAAMSDSFAELTDQEKELLDEFVGFLKAET